MPTKEGIDWSECPLVEVKPGGRRKMRPSPLRFYASGQTRGQTRVELAVARLILTLSSISTK